MGYPQARHAAALEHEKAFWRRTVGTAGWHGAMLRADRELARHFEAVLAKYVPPPRRRVLQVGPAGRDAIHFMDAGLARFAVDPLVRFYRRELGLPAEGVAEAAALGEALPFRDGACDGLVCVNVLDHTWQPDRVLAELHRVLRPGGALFPGVDVREPGDGGAVDAIHLWRFDRDDVERRVEAAGFTLHERELHEHGKPTDARWFWLVATA